MNAEHANREYVIGHGGIRRNEAWLILSISAPKKGQLVRNVEL